jgi:hypothetical protein
MERLAPDELHYGPEHDPTGGAAPDSGVPGIRSGQATHRDDVRSPGKADQIRNAVVTALGAELAGSCNRIASRVESGALRSPTRRIRSEGPRFRRKRRLRRRQAASRKCRSSTFADRRPKFPRCKGCTRRSPSHRPLAPHRFEARGHRFEARGHRKAATAARGRSRRPASDDVRGLRRRSMGTMRVKGRDQLDPTKRMNRV